MEGYNYDITLMRASDELYRSVKDLNSIGVTFEKIAGTIYRSLEKDEEKVSQLVFHLQTYLSNKSTEENILPDIPIVICDTGYTSRLIEENYFDKFLDLCEENNLKPIMICDNLWGKGLYVFDDEDPECYKVISYKEKNSEEERKKVVEEEDISEKNKELFIKYGKYGRLFLESKNKNWIPTNFLKELDFCCLFDLEDIEKGQISQYKVKIYKYDSESG